MDWWTRFGKVGQLVIAAIVGGILVAIALYPGAYAIGTAANFANGQDLTLPAEFVNPPTPQTTYVYANDGHTLITTFYDEFRRDVPLSAVSKVFQQAVVAAEDIRFYQHGGVDPQAIVRAFIVDQGADGNAQGASTLTMQYVRNVLKQDPNLTSKQRADATADTFARKIAEARYAIAVEKVLSKQQILERYLNIAYFGDGAYGVYAAAERYFSTTPDKINLAQATMLAGIIQNPDADNPVTGDAKQAKARQTYVLNAMRDHGQITPAVAAKTAAAKFALDPHKAPPNDCTAVPSKHNSWGFFCDYFERWWDSQPAFGVTVADREAALKDGGYKVVTSMDPDIQQSALDQSLSVYGFGNRRALPIAVVQPGTGRVLALAVNRHYSLDKNPKGQRDYPNTVAQLIAGGGGIQGYQSGSTFKLFTMLAALEQGLPLDTHFDAPAQLKTNFPDDGKDACDGFWCPKNAHPNYMDGDRDMWTGFGRSVNTYFVWLEQQVGPQNAVAMAQRLGITFRAPSDARQATKHAAAWGAFTLGVADTTPLDLANAYATIAAGGMYCAPLPVTSITDQSGTKLALGDSQCHQAVDSDIAAAAVDAARCPVGQDSAYHQCDNGGTGAVAGQIFGNRPLGGKTGSSEENATESFVGFTPQVAAAGTAADPANPLDHVGSAVESRVVAAVTRTLATATDNLPAADFPVPSKHIAFGDHPIPPPSPTAEPSPTPTTQPHPNPHPSRSHRPKPTQKPPGFPIPIPIPSIGPTRH